MRGRILFVENSISYALSHRLSLLRALHQEGFDVHVASLTRGDPAPIENRGFTPHVLTEGMRSNNPLREIQLILRLTRLYRRLSPTLIHHVTLRSILYGGVASLFVPEPRVVNAVTGLGYMFASNGAGMRFIQYAVLQSIRLLVKRGRHEFIFQNPDDQKLFESRGVVFPQSSHLIKGSGVDLDTFGKTPIPSETPIVLFPARMLWHKGVGEFIEAARILREESVEARFVLVGNSDPNNPSSVPQEQIKTWDDEGVVEWWGYQESMPDVFAQSSIVCLPSKYREGVPKVLIEAASCGRPIVTTDVPGCREIVQHRENGYVVSPGNPETLADALRDLIHNDTRRQEMGTRGREIVAEEFSDERVIKDTLRVYRSLLH